MGCKKDCEEISEQPPLICGVELFIEDSSSIDVQHYVIRNDSSSLYGVATAIKHVPEIGAIEWIGNNRVIQIYTENYFLGLSNFSDTAWYNLEPWAFSREGVTIKFNPYSLCKQKVFDEATYKRDTTSNYAIFKMNADDFTLATWEIDTKKDSYITVTDFDTSQNVVEGYFDLYFTKVNENSPPSIGSFAEKVEFGCGKFKAKIFEY